MSNEIKSAKLRFGVFDAVILIVIVALIGALVFRFAADQKLFDYNTEQYTVTVKVCGLQYTTIDMLTAGDRVYFENGEELGTLKSSPTVTPKLEYNISSGGDIIASYYPDNTLVDIVTEIDCMLISSNGLLITRNGVHIAAGASLELHTQTVNLTLEIVSVNKVVSE
ncbi:MAG: DUF4330 family protein [Eubacteriales bacterium]